MLLARDSNAKTRTFCWVMCVYRVCERLFRQKLVIVFFGSQTPDVYVLCMSPGAVCWAQEGRALGRVRGRQKELQRWPAVFCGLQRWGPGVRERGEGGKEREREMERRGKGGREIGEEGGKDEAGGLPTAESYLLFVTCSCCFARLLPY